MITLTLFKIINVIKFYNPGILTRIVGEKGTPCFPCIYLYFYLSLNGVRTGRISENMIFNVEIFFYKNIHTMG